MAPNDYVLSVLAGPNAGSTVALPRGRHSIGGGDGDAVVLDGIAAGALTVILRGNAVRFEPSPATSVSHFGGTAIAPQTGGETQLPAIIRLDDTTLVAVARAEPLPPPRRSPWMVAMIAVAAFGLGLVGSTSVPSDLGSAGASDLVFGPEVAPIGASAMPDTMVAAAATGSTPASGAPCDRVCLGRALVELRTLLDAAGLDSLALAQDGGVLRVSGHLPADKRGLWHDLRRDFEARHGQSLPILLSLSEDVAQQDAPAFAVASIWLGENPEIRSSTGEILRPGDVTRDGWQVLEIGPNEVTLRRGAILAEVRF